MKYRKLGNSDLKVSTVTLGTWVFGGDCWGAANDDESIRVVREAVDRGINFIDTAPIYGGGRSEEVIGKALRGTSSDVMIATKCGLEQKGHSIRPNLRASFIREEIENSLRRLGVDRIDLYQCHWPDPNTSIKETFGELNKLLGEGKVRYIGVSNFQKDAIEKAAKIVPIVSNQMQYSLFDRTIEKELLPFCKDADISILTYGSLGGGILSGKYKDPPEVSRGDVKDFFYKFYAEPFWSKGKDLVSVLEEIAGKRNVSTSQVAINWVLARREVASCIVGCRTTAQLGSNVEAMNWELSEEELTNIEGGYSRIFSSR